MLEISRGITNKTFIYFAKITYSFVDGECDTQTILNTLLARQDAVSCVSEKIEEGGVLKVA